MFPAIRANEMFTVAPLSSPGNPTCDLFTSGPKNLLASLAYIRKDSLA